MIMKALTLVYITYKGKRYETCSTSNPLKSYLKKRGIPYEYGPWVHWLIEDNKLYLVSLLLYVKGYNVDLNYLFPEQDKVFAEWFTGEIRIPHGKKIKPSYKYIERRTTTLYEKELFLKIRKGVVVKEWEIDNTHLSRPSIMYLNDFFSNFEWNSFLWLLPFLKVDELVLEEEFNCPEYSTYIENLSLVTTILWNSIHFHVVNEAVFSGNKLFYYPPNCKHTYFEIPFRRTIGYAFKNDFLKEICLNHGNGIYENCFYNLCSLEKVSTKKNMKKYFSQDGVLYMKQSRIEYQSEFDTYLMTGVYLICYPCNNPNKIFAIPDFVSHIAANAFTNSHVTAIKLPKNLRSIGDRAFYNCQDLTTIVLPNSIPNCIGNEIFVHCNNLTYIKNMQQDVLTDEVRKKWLDIISEGRRISKIQDLDFEAFG